MTHNAAVQIIVQLAPEIEKSGAEATILKYARAEDLPPAQLEKLAQTFNTMLTLSHIEKAADRGSAPTGKIDVPVFVTSYAIDDRQPTVTKTATRASHDTHAVNLMAALRQDIAGPPLAKAAAAAAPEPEKSAAQFSRAQLEDILLDHDLDAMFTMEEVANGFSKMAGALDLASAEEDAMHLRSPAMVKRAVDWLCAVTRKQASRHNGTLRPRSVAVTSHAGDQLVKLVDAMAMRQVVKNAAKTVAPPNGPDTQLQEDSVGSPAEDESDFFSHFEQPDTSGEPGGGFLLSPEEEAEGAADAQSRYSREVGGGGGLPPDKSDATPVKGKDQGATGDDKSKPDAGRVSRIASALAAPVRGAGHAIGHTASALDKFLEDVVSKERTNTRQRSHDTSLADIKRSINVQRMIGTDPVLREQDPREVLQIYNAVAQSNPEIAGDMARMRLILREASSYDGLTLDSQKQLTDIRKGTADAEAKESENTKRQYNIGGSAASLLGGKLKA